MTQASDRPEPEILPPEPGSGGSTHGGASSSGSSSGGGDVFENLQHLAEHPMTWPRVTYGLYALSVVSGFPMLVGLIVAYVVRDAAPAWLQGHYTFLIRTFWYFVVLAIAGVATWFLGVGLLLLWLLPIWLGIRVIRGWLLLENRKPVPDPQSWLFG